MKNFFIKSQLKKSLKEIKMEKLDIFIHQIVYFINLKNIIVKDHKE